MNNASTSTTTAPLYDFYSRAVAYISGALTLIVGHQLQVWSDYHTEVIVVAIVYPIIAFIVSKQVPEKYQYYRSATCIAIDAFLVGGMIAYMEFAWIPTILYAVLINMSVLSLGSVLMWATCLVIMACGIYAGTWFFGFQYTPSIPLQLSATIALGISAHLMVTAFFAAKQNKRLAILHNELREQQTEQKNLSHKVAKYISPQIWESIFSGKKEVKLETQRKKLVVFFSDIKGFTQLSEQIESEALTELLNNYLTEMTNIALKYGGTIDKYIGDSIMVFFGDPKTQGAKKDTLACVAMAIEMKKHMKVLRQKWRSQGVQTPLEIRMGINTGYCTVGNFGTEARMDYTIIGKEVNMASRLESAAEAGEILLSHESYALVQDKIICREKGQISVKGFSRPVPVFQAVDFRHNLAAKSTFLEHELPGFSMYMDTNRINNYDREKIATALEHAAGKLKKENSMQG